MLRIVLLGVFVIIAMVTGLMSFHLLPNVLGYGVKAYFYLSLVFLFMIFIAKYLDPQ